MGPRLNGLALAETIRAHDDERIKDLPIYLFTAVTINEEERNRAEELGVTIESKSKRTIEEAAETIHFVLQEEATSTHFSFLKTLIKWG